MEETSGIAYWVDPETHMARVVFDPWCSRDQAYNTHTHLHTEWAENIYDNYNANALIGPAEFPEWAGKTIILVGRGPSAKDSRPYLENAEIPMVFLNHAYLDWTPGGRDWVMVIDPRFGGQEIDKEKVSRLGIVAMPGVPNDIISDFGWRDRRGFTFWNKAPLNNWMRKLYPCFPELIECMSVSTTVLHLAAINNVKRVICVGWDFCNAGSGEVTATDINGDQVQANIHHLRASQSATFFARLIGQHLDMEIINASGRGFFGLNVSSNPPERVEEIKQVTPDGLPKLLEE